MDIKAYFEYINSHGVDLFTVVLLPNGNDRFPTVIVRTPYVDWLEDKTEEFIVELCKGENIPWLERGYAMVIQYCRGRGKSSGDCIPYIPGRLEEGYGLNPIAINQLHAEGVSVAAISILWNLRTLFMIMTIESGAGRKSMLRH